MESQARLTAIMKEKAESVQTIVTGIASLHEAFQQAVAVTKKQGGSTIAAPGLDESHRGPFRKLCEENGLTLLESNLRDSMSGIHTGFTIAEWGIAETGTLVQNSTSEDLRIATMLSETHVAVLPESRIRPDSMSLENELSQIMKTPHRYLSFISGASRTADIERVLTIGVHGPQELHILIMEETRS